MITVESVLNESREWLTGLDRTILGKFACDAEYMILRNAFIRLSWSEGSVAVDSPVNNVMSELNDLMDEYLMKMHLSETGLRNDFRNKVRDEINFWWAVSNDEVWVTRSYVFDDYRDDRTWVDRYMALFTVPARLPYFEAGLFDVVKVDRFIRDDIDIRLVFALENA